MVSTKTSTDSVNGSISRVVPSSTSMVFTWKVAKVTSSLVSKFKVMKYSAVVVASAAVTTMLNKFSPTIRSSLPEISTVASASVVCTSTSTVSVPASMSMVSPSTTSLPFTNMPITLASVFSATFNVT